MAEKTLQLSGKLKVVQMDSEPEVTRNTAMLRIVNYAKEYADELEHQHNGSATWGEEFENDTQAAVDFARYILSKEE